MPRVLPSQVVAMIKEMFPVVLEERYTKITLTRDTIEALGAVVHLVESIPDELIALEGNDFTEYTLGFIGLKQEISHWSTATEKRGQNMIFVHGKGQLTPLDLVLNALEKCPDETPAPSTVDLQFITDPDLRLSLRTDISTAYSDLIEGKWKPATVLAGSVVEALLLWSLQQRPPSDITSAVASLISNGALKSKPGQNLEGWNLFVYITVASYLSIIGDTTTRQSLLAKDFRNLIHPGKAARLGQVCNRGTALAALAAVDQVVEDIQ